MKQQIQQIEQWAEDRNLIEGSTPERQAYKLMEEFGELCAGIAKGNKEMIKDAIGDCFVVLTIINKQRKESSSGLDQDLRHTGFDLRVAIWILSQYIDNELTVKTPVEVLICAANDNGLNFKDCVQHAYDQIKDRKGKMIDGVFVKEEDLRNEQQ